MWFLVVVLFIESRSVAVRARNESDKSARDTDAGREEFTDAVSNNHWRFAC